MALFENYERRVDKINSVLAQYGISSIEECKEITLAKGIDCDKIVRGTQPICFENAIWAYTVGCAIAIKSGAVKAADAAAAIGIGLQSFCIPGSVAENRKVGLGHGNLGKMLLSEETECFCFLAGHESFAAAEGAIKIALNANKVRTKPLRVILNGLGKDAAMIISRINGFTYCKTEFDPYTETVTVTEQKAYSNGPRADVKCYGADNVPEGVAIMKLENVGVSITGNSTNPTRFQHPVAGTYKKWCVENGVNYFSVASGGGTGRTLQAELPELLVTDGCIYISANRIAPGVIQKHGAICRIVYGLPSHKTDHPVLQQVETDLKNAGIDPVYSPYVERDTLLKFAYVSPNAACGQYYHAKAAEMQHPGEVRDSFVRLIKEVVALADKMGIPLESRPGELVERNLRILDALAPTASTSMQRDMEAGKQSEVDGLIYQVVRLAEQYDVDVPEYRKIAEAVKKQTENK